MASNNYAEVITDPIEARQVVADFKRLAALGWTFKVLEFNPDTDRFAIYGGRESNFPTLLDVEAGGVAIDGATLSSKLGDAAQAIDFGNGYIGLFYESDGLGSMAIPNGKKLQPTEPVVTASAGFITETEIGGFMDEEKQSRNALSFWEDTVMESIKARTLRGGKRLVKKEALK
jgi:hypothetical protein